MIILLIMFILHKLSSQQYLYTVLVYVKLYKCSPVGHSIKPANGFHLINDDQRWQKYRIALKVQIPVFNKYSNKR